MPLEANEIAYFDRTQGENAWYWKRFGHVPDMQNRCVMEIGCGYGALCIDAALRGANYVVGLDLQAERIQVAREYLQQQYPELVSRIEFLCIDLMCYPTASIFDYVISKDSFEHIIDLETVLPAIEQRLKPGGRLYTGFGPLYHAPYGDHGRLAMTHYGPWGHLLLSEPRLLRRLNRKYDREASSIADLGLNQLKVTDYQHLFATSGLELVQCKTNVVGGEPFKRRAARRVMAMVSQLPGLRDYMTSNIYAILEKPCVDPYNVI